MYACKIKLCPLVCVIGENGGSLFLNRPEHHRSNKSGIYAIILERSMLVVLGLLYMTMKYRVGINMPSKPMRALKVWKVR